LAFKNDPPNHESTPQDLFSSMETRAMLEEFRELVRAGILRVTPENEVLPVKEPPAGGAPSPESPPSQSREEDVALLDKQLVDLLERRRSRRPEGSQQPAAGPAKPATGGLRQLVVEKLAEKILEMWERADQSTGPQSSLREQVASRIVDELLKKWQRGLE